MKLITGLMGEFGMGLDCFLYRGNVWRKSPFLFIRTDVFHSNIIHTKEIVMMMTPGVYAPF